jgi:CRISPR-associated protein Csx14
MSRASIPVDLLNPGEVFASLGFLEAAAALCSFAIGGFDWADESNIRFVLDAENNQNPFDVVLEFLASAEVHRIVPWGYEDSPKRKEKEKRLAKDDEEGQESPDDLERSGWFPTREPDRMSLPVRLTHAGRWLDMTHWADGSSRDDFKLYAGNRSAAMIAKAMLMGTMEKRKGKGLGELKTKGIRTLWEEDPSGLAEHPFDVLTAVGGSFNFDPRSAWAGIDAGYSPNDQKHGVTASPAVELLAAIGLEHARPGESQDRGEIRVRYAAWGEAVPPSLARPLLAGAPLGVPLRRFAFTLSSSGKNKIVTVAEEEISS